jgi:hypothetical protein
MGYEPGKGLGKEGQVCHCDNRESNDEHSNLLIYIFLI